MWSVRALIVRVPLAVRWVTMTFALLLVGWSLITPLSRAPDEAAHVDLILHLSTGAPYPDYDGLQRSQGTVRFSSAHLPGLEAESAPARSQARSFNEWGGDKPVASTNQMPQHPPLYYEVAATALRAGRLIAPGDEPGPLSREWHLLRLMNVAMVAPVPLLAWATAARLRAAPAAATTAALVPLAVPQLIHIGASINNDNLLILLAAVLAPLLAGVLRGDGRRRTALAIAAVVSLALLTKAFAVVLLPWVVVVYAASAGRDRHRWRSLAPALAIAALIPAVVGAWWPVRNIVRHGRPLPSSLDWVLGTHPPGFVPEPMWYARHFASSVTQRFWGDFGYYEAALAPVVVVAATVVVLVGVGAALWPRRPGREGADPPPPSRGHLVVMAVPFVLLAATVLVRAYRLYLSIGTTPFMQGRYLFYAIVPFALVVGVGLHRLVGRWAPAGLIAGVTLMQVEALRVALDEWWADGDASVGRSVSALLAWSPWPPAVAIAVACGAVGSWLVTVWLCLRPTRTPVSIGSG